jgi:hypothetical protein
MGGVEGLLMLVDEKSTEKLPAREESTRSSQSLNMRGEESFFDFVVGETRA